ncbi:MAG: dephospho-CoA kinase [Clostridia bacterium]|nr:dephospho-CoA kinase [Clostridia bacterium]
MKPNKPYILGLTGGIACGKSHVAAELRALGVPVLDADGISRSVTAEGGEALPAIREAFGGAVFNGQSLDRRALGRIVFEDDEKRRQLEHIIHPIVISRMRRETEVANAPIVGWDVPLLYETGMDAQCDEVWCVYITEQEQLRRVMRRDHLSREAAQARIDSQWPMADKKARAQHRVSTMGSRAATRHHVRTLLRDLQRRLRHE